MTWIESEALSGGDGLHVERRAGGLVVLTLDWPAKRNAIPPDWWPRLRDLVRALDEDETVGAVVLTGAGSVFSSGADLRAPRPAGAGPLAPASRVAQAHEAIDAILGARYPVVAAVEGYAVGIAWSLVLSCDLVVAAEDAFFSAPFLARGLVPDGALGWLLARRVARGRAFDLLTSGERLGAPDAHRAGLVERLAPPGEALRAAMDAATAVAGGPRYATALTKRLLRRASTSSLEDYLADERLAVALNASGPDAAEGRAAFAEGRDPRWDHHRTPDPARAPAQPEGER